ncbi:ferritin-like domain-containing protein [soil metagenome]
MSVVDTPVRDQQDPTMPFLSDVQTLRSRAREPMMDGAVTSSYALDLKQAVQVLNQALATEIVCVLRYKRHSYMAKGPNSEPIAAEFATHAAEEQAHADLIAERIVQLGGGPDFNPEGLLSRGHSQYVEGQNLREMIEENLIAERIAIDSYREMAHWFGPKDSTTRRMLEGILAQEEEHADDMADLLERHQGV